MRQFVFLTIALLIACTPVQKPLPFLGIHDLSNNPDGTRDTLYYTLPKFSLTGLNDEALTHRKLEGRVHVASFIFTHCPTICPVMSAQMVRLQSALIKSKMADDVRMISFSIDPERDTPERLREYADLIGADTSSWYFATGDQKELHLLANKGYLQTALSDSTSPGGFAHSEMFVLADHERHIRGVYDGTSTKEVDRLFDDIGVLLSNHE